MGSSPTPAAICECRPTARHEASNLEMGVRFPPLAPWSGGRVAYRTGLLVRNPCPGSWVRIPPAPPIIMCARSSMVENTRLISVRWCAPQGILGEIVAHQKAGSHGMLESKSIDRYTGADACPLATASRTD